MPTRIITHTAIALSLVALSGCYSPQPLSVSTPALLPDGHSTLALASGSVCTTDCWHGVTVAGVVRSHWVNGVYVSEPQDFRPISTPAPGLDLAEIIVPPVIQGGATVGAGLLVSRGIMQAGAWEGEGAAASGKAIGQGVATGDKSLGQGVAAAKPSVNTNTNVNTPVATAVSASTSTSSANASSHISAVQQNVNNNNNLHQTQQQSQLQLQGFFLNGQNLP